MNQNNFIKESIIWWENNQVNFWSIQARQEYFWWKYDKLVFDLGKKFSFLREWVMFEFLFYLAKNNWFEINYDEVASLLDVSNKKARRILSYLKQKKVIFLLKKFDDIGYKYKIYFYDNWFRNYILKNFLDAEYRNDNWFLFEGFVISNILKKWIKEKNIFYRQDENKKEVDLIINQKNKLLAVEIKYKNKFREKDIDSLKYFSAKFLSVPFLVNTTLEWYYQGVNFVNPFYDFVKEYSLQ